MTDTETRSEEVTADKVGEVAVNDAGSQTFTRKAMNPSSWSNPPPPGIDVDEESKHSTVSSKSVSGSIIDVIDPYIKNPEYVKYKKSLSREPGHYRRSSRSRSPHDRHRSRSHDRKRRYRSRSRSRGRRRRSRSRRRRRSSTRSRSSSHERRHHRRRRKRSRRRSRSRHGKAEPVRSGTRSPAENDAATDDGKTADAVEDDDDEPDVSKENAFKNDGSFLEMFKRMQEEEKAKEQEAAAASSSEPKRPLPAFGKRRGGRVLKTGMVEKTKACEDDTSNAQDPWSIYLKEVKKYKEACCDDDSKTRPLVK